MTKKKRLLITNMTASEIDKRVKLRGSMYDRRRKLSDKDIVKMKKYARNHTLKDTGRKFGVVDSTVRYHVRPGNKEFVNQLRKKYRWSDNVTESYHNRVAYKRSLAMSSKVKV